MRKTAMRRSVGARTGHALEPVTEHAGFDWRINDGSFGARELTVSTMGVIFGIEDTGDDPAPLAEKIREAKASDGKPAYAPARERHEPRLGASVAPQPSEPAGSARHLHYAPYLDYRPLEQDEPSVQAILDRPESAWIARELEQKALGHAIANVVPEHLQEVRGRRLTWTDKARAAVKDRLTKEIGYWDHCAEQLRLQEQAGKANARLNSQEARRRADDPQARMQKRLAQLDLEAQVSALPPVALGGLIVVPMALRDAPRMRRTSNARRARRSSSAAST